MEDNSSDFMLECKIVVIGNSTVGKTSIIDRYVNNKFNVEI